MQSTCILQLRTSLRRPVNYDWPSQVPVLTHNAADAHSCVDIDTETSLVEQYPTVNKAVDSCKQLTNNFGSKRPALKYLSTVVYCSTSEVPALNTLSMLFHTPSLTDV